MPKPAILFAMPISPRLRDRLADRYELFGPLDRQNPLPLPPGAEKAQALVTLGSLRTDAALMDALPQLGFIACYGTGFEGVDRAEAIRRGIRLTHAGEANATAVAEFAMGLVIAAGRNLARGDRLVRAGKWANLAIDRVPLTPGLAGQRMGIYGMGSIGMKIAQRAAAFEMEIGYHNRSRRGDVDHAYFGSLKELATWADVLVVAVRASAENRHAVNAEILEALGPEGVLVNISRGIAVDETALCEALETGRILGAGLDVYQNEPHVPERLMALENAVLTPHMAALSLGAQRAQQKVLVDNLDAFFSGRPLSSLMPAA
ncbi:2-hydroxyacid dehydrogenase [Roseococcus sp. YIM B11640]|uniref:2-hydroxyacid dehydrogenase n=1 Tax=Roseococcus sp. YIM B11640 TaxID=3133973 RepID=UPI003C7CAFAC